jgi:glycosyltransferase involved in cell wall biosynthesis/predicted metal-dependent phosphoesterase TrpH
MVFIGVEMNLSQPDTVKEPGKMKVDLHVHSKYSTRPSQWVLQKIGCPESFTEPLRIYDIARKKGMSLVTITDHNTIAGALEIAHLPGTFLGEEVTAYFPEDGCKVHVLALDITEENHRDIQKARQSIYELVEYLNNEGIFHALAHPLYSVNDRLTAEHFEKFLLLFRNFELNGSRDPHANQLIRDILESLEPGQIHRLAEKHGIEPLHTHPWEKNLVGGSDDHSSLNIARTHTEVREARNLESFFSGIGNHGAQVVGNPSSPLTMAHNLYGIAYQFYRSKFGLERYIKKDILMNFLDRSLKTDPAEKEAGLGSRLYFFWQYRKAAASSIGVSETLQEMVQHITRKLIRENPELRSITESRNFDRDEMEKTWFHFVNQTSSHLLMQMAGHLLGPLSGASVFNLFQCIGSSGGLYFLLAPYFVAFSHFAGERGLLRQLGEQFRGQDPEVARVAHFTDTFSEINGVALTLKQQVRLAVENGKNLQIVTCEAEDRGRDAGVRNFKPIGVYALPEYPEQKIFIPPLLEMLTHIHEERCTHIVSATPGPVGLCALAIARILNLPIHGTYHTALPQYARFLTDDATMENLMWKYILWYYDQMDLIYAPSESTRAELIEKGIRPEKVVCYPRGIDTERFTPAKRNGYFEHRYGIREKIKLLYVGRISREKNLPLLAEVFKSLVRTAENVRLVVVGDGPYLPELKELLAATPCTFTGYLEGEDLTAAYASSDLFIFPSTTDTFGNVVLEAQASGLPVVVTDQGGPRENIIPGKTGLVVRGNDPQSLLEAVLLLVKNPAQIREMGISARRYVESRTFQDAFHRTWSMFEEPDPQQEAVKTDYRRAV